MASNDIIPPEDLAWVRERMRALKFQDWHISALSANAHRPWLKSLTSRQMTMISNYMQESSKGYETLSSNNFSNWKKLKSRLKVSARTNYHMKPGMVVSQAHSAFPQSSRRHWVNFDLHQHERQQAGSRAKGIKTTLKSCRHPILIWQERSTRVRSSFI